jgi:hypothetical protein
MNNFLRELKQRNSLLYWFGWYNFAIAIICIVLMQFDDIQILGINRWIKPMKFFLSVGIMVWTMGWIMHYLQYRRTVRICSWLIVISMFVENFIIILQSSRGEPSHFNVREPLNAMLFTIMGIFIVLFTITAIYIAVLFFRQKQYLIPVPYLWGIRLGLLVFIFFTSEGGMMVAKLAHTIGGPDGGPGLPLINWSTRYGDLRVAHFFGMHALQILPLFGYYIAKKKNQTILFSTLYFVFVMFLFVRAMWGAPLFF